MTLKSYYQLTSNLRVIMPSRFGRYVVCNAYIVAKR